MKTPNLKEFRKIEIPSDFKSRVLEKIAAKQPTVAPQAWALALAGVAIVTIGFFRVHQQNAELASLENAAHVVGTEAVADWMLLH